MRRLLSSLVLALAAGIVVAGVTPADRPQTVDGMAVYVGVLPAAMVEGHPPGHPEAAMHGGMPRGRHRFHVLVALFDAGSGERIRAARVEARVAELGLGGTQRTLEPMAIADTETYGGYFKLDGEGPFRITLDIRRQGAQRVTRAEFEYRHRWVAR